MVRPLDALAKDTHQGRKWFAYEYAGSFIPITPPHNANWDTADTHWIAFNEAALETNLAANRPRAERIHAAERFSIVILWYLVREPKRTCPGCVGSDPEEGSPRWDLDDYRRLVKASNTYLDEHLELSGPPDLDALMKKNFGGADPTAAEQLVSSALRPKHPMAPPHRLLTITRILLATALGKGADDFSPADMRALQWAMARGLGIVPIPGLTPGFTPGLTSGWYPRLSKPSTYPSPTGYTWPAGDGAPDISTPKPRPQPL